MDINKICVICVYMCINKLIQLCRHLAKAPINIRVKCMTSTIVDTKSKNIFNDNSV